MRLNIRFCHLMLALLPSHIPELDPRYHLLGLVQSIQALLEEDGLVDLNVLTCGSSQIADPGKVTSCGLSLLGQQGYAFFPDTKINQQESD